MRFFVFTASEFPKIYRRLLKIAEDFGRVPKIAEGFQRLPKISRRLPKITKGVERVSMTSTQGRQWFPKDFQLISSIIRVPMILATSWTSKNNWIFIAITLAIFSYAWEILLWIHEITILYPQVWDSSITRKSWRVYDCAMQESKTFIWVLFIWFCFSKYNVEYKKIFLIRMDQLTSKIQIKL